MTSRVPRSAREMGAWGKAFAGCAGAHTRRAYSGLLALSLVLVLYSADPFAWRRPTPRAFPDLSGAAGAGAGAGAAPHPHVQVVVPMRDRAHNARAMVPRLQASLRYNGITNYNILLVEQLHRFAAGHDDRWNKGRLVNIGAEHTRASDPDADGMIVMHDVDNYELVPGALGYHQCIDDSIAQPVRHVFGYPPGYFRNFPGIPCMGGIFCLKRRTFEQVCCIGEGRLAALRPVPGKPRLCGPPPRLQKGGVGRGAWGVGRGCGVAHATETHPVPTPHTTRVVLKRRFCSCLPVGLVGRV